MQVTCLDYNIGSAKTIEKAGGVLENIVESEKCGEIVRKKRYWISLKKRYAASIKTGEFKRNLNRIEKWCKYRNEIVHALFNKDLVDLHKGYKQHVQSGMELARYVDNQVKALKKA